MSVVGKVFRVGAVLGLMGWLAVVAVKYSLYPVSNSGPILVCLVLSCSFLLFCALAIWSFAVVVFIDPGSVEYVLKNLDRNPFIGSQTCPKCGLPKPPRCHHCSKCDRCILFMDHHCDFLGNCLGYRNYKALVLMYFYTGCASGCVFLGVICAFIVDGWNDALYRVLFGILAFSISSFFWMFVKLYSDLYRSNQTTIGELFPIIDDNTPLPPLETHEWRDFLPIPPSIRVLEFDNSSIV